MASRCFCGRVWLSDGASRVTLRLVPLSPSLFRKHLLHTPYAQTTRTHLLRKSFLFDSVLCLKSPFLFIVWFIKPVKAVSVTHRITADTQTADVTAEPEMPRQQVIIDYTIKQYMIINTTADRLGQRQRATKYKLLEPLQFQKEFLFFCLSYN